ncbi:MAG: hypothetical protein U0805_15130 [Pirellulales bacterium]
MASSTGSPSPPSAHSPPTYFHFYRRKRGFTLRTMLLITTLVAAALGIVVYCASQ